jgi:hypothetical protein
VLVLSRAAFVLSRATRSAISSMRVAWLVVHVAFFILAVQLFITLIEFKPSGRFPLRWCNEEVTAWRHWQNGNMPGKAISCQCTINTGTLACCII